MTDPNDPTPARPAASSPSAATPTVRGLSRRDAILSGAAFAAGGGLMAARSATAQPAPGSAPGSAPATAPGSTAPGDQSVPPTNSNTPPQRDHQNPFTQDAMQRRMKQVARIDPDNPLPPGQPGTDYTPIHSPDNVTLPFEIKGGVKVFHMVAEEFLHTFADGLEAYCWGYNGHTPGPVIEAVEGDRVRIYVTNKLPAPTTVHWHGFILPSGMDGVSGVVQPPIPRGKTWVYEFTLRQHGTFMYHSHHQTMVQEGMGLMGMFIVHPRRSLRNEEQIAAEVGPPVDRDFVIMLQEWRIEVGAKRPDPFEMTDFNVLTMNGKVMPDTQPLVVRKDERVRLRFGNLSAMDHHPIHLHGYEFAVTAQDGAYIPPHQQRMGVTELLSVGNTRDLEIIAEYEGDWIFHCHMTHHVMNQMGHEFPNSIGVVPSGLDQQVQKILPNYMTMATNGMGDMTEMGMALPENSIPMKGSQGPYGHISLAGMANVLKVRANVSDQTLADQSDPGWYKMPEGTQVRAATADELRRDGIRGTEG